MLDTSELTKRLTGRIGLYSGVSARSNLPAAIHRDPAMYLSDAHKLLRPDILQALGPNSKDANVSYNPEKRYDKYDVVQDESVFYESVTSSNLGHPVTDPLFWQETTPLSSWYNRIERGAIRKLALALAMNPPAKAVLDRQPIFNNEGNIQGAIMPTGRFVGVKVIVKKSDVAVLIARLALQLTAPVTSLPVYIFHSESSKPVKTITLHGTTSFRSVWADVNEYLYHKGSGYYVIGYFESDLPIGVKAIGTERGFTVEGCSSCFGADYAFAASRKPYVDISSVYVDNTGNLVSGVYNWPTESSVARQTWGLNFIIEARCDVTSTILENEDMLTNTLLTYIACDVLEELSTTDRVNSLVPNMKSAAYVALYGQANAKTDFGLSGRLEKLTKDLKAVMAEVAPLCLKTEAGPQRRLSFSY